MPKYLVSNNHPAIIDRDTFKQVQSEMAKRRSRPRVSDKTITARVSLAGNIPFRIYLYVIRVEIVTDVVCGFPAVRKNCVALYYANRAWR